MIYTGEGGLWWLLVAFRQHAYGFQDALPGTLGVTAICSSHGYHFVNNGWNGFSHSCLGILGTQVPSMGAYLLDKLLKARLLAEGIAIRIVAAYRATNIEIGRAHV